MRGLRHPSTIVGALLLLGCAQQGPEIRHVVLVSIDTLGAKHSSTYGYERETTPNLSRIAEEGTLFERAYTPQTWTMSAHLSMLTGLYPLAHGAAKGRPASPVAPTLTEILKERGFATAAFTGAGGYAGPAYGLGRGFEVFRTGRRDAKHDNLERFEWLREQARRCEQDREHRFFLFAHYFDVHSDDGKLPYTAPLPYRFHFMPEGLHWNRRGGTALLRQLEESGQANEADRSAINALYDGGVRYADGVGLGGLVELLVELDLYEETLLIVTSDHGEEIFEHGQALHQQPYEEIARVPLVVRGPGILRGQRVPQLVELVDLPPTVLSLLEIPIPDHVQGRDLAPVLREGIPPAGSSAYVDGIFGAVPPHPKHKKSSVVREIDGRHWSFVTTVYSRRVDGRRGFETRGGGELYLLERDPEQRTNLAPQHPELTEELETELLAWYDRNQQLSDRLGQEPLQKSMLKPAERDELRALGYLE